MVCNLFPLFKTQSNKLKEKQSPKNKRLVEKEMTIVLFLRANLSSNSSTTEKAVLNLFFPISIRFFKSEPRGIIEILLFIFIKLINIQILLKISIFMVTF